MRLRLLGLALLLGACARSAHGGYAYTVVDLGYGRGFAVNNSGQVAGSFTNQAGVTDAFLTGAGGQGITDLGNLGGGRSFGYGLNDTGQVVGLSLVSGGAQHAFRTGPNGQGMVDLGTLGGQNSSAASINASGQVAGSSQRADGSYRAVVTAASGQGLTNLGSFGGFSSFATGINDSGQVAVYAGSTGSTTAYLLDANHQVITQLAMLGGTTITTDGLNNAGQVVGAAGTSSGGSHAFVTMANGQGISDLGTLAGAGFSSSSEAFAINTAGQIVGGSFTALGRMHAFFSTGTGMVDLNSLTDPSSGLELNVARSISDSGYIAGYGTDARGLTHAFLLVPNTIPEPGSLVLLGVGMVAVTGAWVRAASVRRRG